MHSSTSIAIRLRIEHRRRLHQVLAERDRRELERQAARRAATPRLHRLGEPAEVQVAVDELRPRVADADDRPPASRRARSPAWSDARWMKPARSRPPNQRALRRESGIVRIYVTGEIPPAVAAALAEDFELVGAPEVDGILSLLTTTVDAALLDRAGPGLRIVANYAVGVNNLDLDAARSHNVLVANTPDVLTRPTAELALTLMLSLLRRVTEANLLAARLDQGGGDLQDPLRRDMALIGATERSRDHAFTAQLRLPGRLQDAAETRQRLLDRPVDVAAVVGLRSREEDADLIKVPAHIERPLEAPLVGDQNR